MGYWTHIACAHTLCVLLSQVIKQNVIAGGGASVKPFTPLDGRSRRVSARESNQLEGEPSLNYIVP